MDILKIAQKIKLKEFAPGIKDRNDYPELPKIEEPKEWKYVLHRHEAKRKGEHLDLRLGDPDTGHGHSWALNDLPGPGESTYAIHQPVHSLEYFNFKGEIPSGYGAGKVHIEEKDKIEIINSKPGHISFNVYKGYGPEEYTLHRIGDKMWKLYNRTKKKDDLNLPLYRPKYKETKIDKALDYGDDHLMSAKIDDTHQLFYFDKDRIRAFSHRESSKHPSGLIEHTHKIDLPTPSKEFNGTILRGGIYAIDKRTNRPIQNAILGGLMNSNVWKSRESQKDIGELKSIIYDVEKFKGKDMSKEPYEKKLEILKEINEKHPTLELPSMAVSKRDKEKLIKEIKKGRHPNTTEGVVLWPLKESKPPIKAKIFQEDDVYIKGFFPGKGKHESKRVGGFFFSHTENGPIVGRVGTGLSDSLREDMHKNPDKYLGLAATVGSHEKYKSEALRVPSFKQWNIDKCGDRLDDVLKK